MQENNSTSSHNNNPELFSEQTQRLAREGKTLDDDLNEVSISEITDTKAGTAEQGALKTIHRNYNKLNGFEAMLHIINRFSFVLYPFIFLSVIGSTYSFYNDFIVSFPMNGKGINLVIAFFYSLMLEIVRDGAIIAIFNSKMNLPSRTLVILIFLAVTSYMYSSHLKAIDVIEKHAIEYTLAHQTTKSQTVTNPKIGMIEDNLNRALSDLNSTKTEYSKQLDISANAKFKVNKINAQNQLPILKKDKEKYEANVKAYQAELLSLKEENIKSVEDSQALISNILLATLLLTESLAMLGAVIKFINTDNAQKEIAKHSEIVEEYVEISEQMRNDNEELTKNLSKVVKGQSESNQQVMEMISNDMRESAKLNIQFIQAIADNKRETMQQMNQVLQMINSSTVPTMNAPYLQELAEPKEVIERQIGFRTNSKEEIVTRLFQGGAVEKDEKLTTKEKVVGKSSRSRNEAVSEVYKILVNKGAIKRNGNKGYFAKTDYQTALKMLGEDGVPWSAKE